MDTVELPWELMQVVEVGLHRLRKPQPLALGERVGEVAGLHQPGKLRYREAPED